MHIIVLSASTGVTQKHRESKTAHRVTSAKNPVELKSVVSLGEPLGQLCVWVTQRLTPR